jgi:Leucine-rich repeat (LRR) protein
MAKRTQEDWLSGIESLLLSTDEADISAAIAKLDERDAWGALCEGTMIDCDERGDYRATLKIGKTITKHVSAEAREDLAWLALRRTGSLDALRKIDLWKPKLTRLDAFSALPALTELHIGAPPLLVRAELHGLPALTTLVIAESKTLRDVALSALPALRELNLQECKAVASVELSSDVGLEELSLADATKLERLSLDGATKLRTLTLHVAAMPPDSFASITCPSLQTLVVRSSKAKELVLPPPSQLPSLARLELERCALASVAALASHACLKTLRLWLLNKLKSLAFVKAHPSLTVVEVTACPALADVSALSTVASLTEVTLSEVGCGRDAVRSLVGVTSLYLGDDVSPEGDLRSLAPLRALRSLSVSGPQLRALDGVEALEQLEELSLNRTQLATLAPLAARPALVFFGVSSDETLATLDGVESLSNLRRLTVTYMPSIASIAAVESLRNVRSLSLIDLPKLSEAEIERVGALASVEELTLFTLPALRSARWLSKLSQLRTLSISGCDSFTDAAGIEQCRSLATLSFNGSRALKTVQNLRTMTWLASLDLRYCDALDHTMSRWMETEKDVRWYFDDASQQQQ